MKPFRERNPIPIAIVGVAVLVAAVLGAFKAGSLFSGGTTYTADFSDAAGLMPRDDVRIAGVKVGSVDSVKLHGDVVRVSFDVASDQHLGRATRADIKIKTLLGQKYIAITPAGPGSLAATIPVDRTSTPLDVTTAFIGLSNRIGDIDTAQLAKSFQTIAKTFSNSPQYVKSSLEGLARLSQTISSRDAQLQQLLQHARGVTGVLASRDTELRKLIDDAHLILTTVEQQRDTIHQLLVNTTSLSEQLTGLVQDNSAVVGPALDHLHQVVAILQANQDNLTKTVHLLAPFVRGFDNALGGGRWFDTWVANLFTGQNGIDLGGVANGGG